MDILPWLLFGATLGIAARYAGPWAARRFSATSRSSADSHGTAPASPAGSLWRSVSIIAGGGACATARRLANQRWLAGDAPRLPLIGCDADRCQCRYRRFADRRDEEDRRNPLDTMGRFGGIEATSSKERRQPSRDRRSE